MTQSNHHQVKLSQDSFVVQAGQTILEAALTAGIDFPYSCQVGSCASCKCQLKSGEIRALLDFAYVLEDHELDQGMILACQSTAKSDLEIGLINDEAV
jgi:3-phenylpropionate/trans-cinnamate dioxygenase ferredoxin reductase subunit